MPKELFQNAILAFVAGAVTTFGTFVASNEANPGKAALLGAAGAAVYAGFRALVGFIVLKFGNGLTVDK